MAVFMYLVGVGWKVAYVTCGGTSDNVMSGIQMTGKSLKTTNSTFYFKAS